ncbi:uncharacterized protein LOC142338179 [Convolutriloba macropyga]|uniref:uncharacterized protein LOC142338179 n=1 Tax=Convolutriloba macropyga TaxID=536237 RepID=UPI003F51C3F0
MSITFSGPALPNLVGLLSGKHVLISQLGGTQVQKKSSFYYLYEPLPHASKVRERLVQIVKRALLLNLGSAKLTWDVFTTIVAEAECLVNARPLTHARSDNEDEDPLTPNHFLIGRAFPNIPACVSNENPSLKTKSWTQIRQRLEAIWMRLVREYLPSLNTRRKWTNPESKLEVNDIVWVLEEWTPRGIWPLGRVTRTFTGPDQTARSCEVKTALGLLTRPAVRLAHVFPKPIQPGSYESLIKGNFLVNLHVYRDTCATKRYNVTADLVALLGQSREYPVPISQPHSVLSQCLIQVTVCSEFV